MRNEPRLSDFVSRRCNDNISDTFLCQKLLRLPIFSYLTSFFEFIKDLEVTLHKIAIAMLLGCKSHFT